MFSQSALIYSCSVALRGDILAGQSLPLHLGKILVFGLRWVDFLQAFFYMLDHELVCLRLPPGAEC